MNLLVRSYSKFSDTRFYRSLIFVKYCKFNWNYDFVFWKRKHTFSFETRTLPALMKCFQNFSITWSYDIFSLKDRPQQMCLGVSRVFLNFGVLTLLHSLVAKIFIVEHVLRQLAAIHSEVWNLEQINNLLYPKKRGLSSIGWGCGKQMKQAGFRWKTSY